MASYYAYCALCGALARDPSHLNHDHANFNLEDPPFSSTSWSGDVRIIGENVNSACSDRVFFSGRARALEYKDFIVEPGDDPRFPGFEEAIFTTYCWSKTQQLFVPVHADCYEVLTRVLADRPIDLEVLYRVFKSRLRFGNTRSNSLQMDYGPIRQYMEMWSRQRHIDGFDTFESSPASTLKAERHYRSLTRPPSTKLLPSTIPMKEATGCPDGFAKLAPELLLRIMENLDGRSVCSLRAASRPAARVVLNNRFWKTMIRNDMPWIYDLPLLEEDGPSYLADWKVMYTQLQQSATLRHPRRHNTLANRKRIWSLCRGIATDYLALLEEKHRDGTAPPDTVIDAISSFMPRMTLPEPREITSVTVSLIDSYNELHYKEPIFSVTWSPSGDLVGLGVVEDPSEPVGLLHRRELLRIPPNDWLTGFVVTTRGSGTRGGPASRRIVGLQSLYTAHNPVQHGQSEGDQRLIHVYPDHFVVGFFLRISADTGVLENLAVLQQPIYKAPELAHDRLLGKHYGPYSELATQCLWKNRLPPPNVESYVSTPAAWHRSMDLRPMEMFFFGDSEQRLENIVAISGDVGLRRFQINYADGSSRAIGSKGSALKTMLIDGRGGERIVFMSWQTGGNSPGMRFVTSNDRQLVLGWPTEMKTVHKHSESMRPQGTALVGLFCRWSDGSTADDIHPLFVPDPACDPDIDEGSLWDGNVLYWEPKELPESKRRVGPAYGWAPDYGDNIPTSDHIPSLSWLDCEKPLESVGVILYQWGAFPKMPIVSMVFKYADGHDITLGPRSFPLPPDRWTPDSCRGRSDRGEYGQDTWHLGGSKVRSLRVWWNERDWVKAIQMTSENGLTSTRWGSVAQGDTGSEILFSHGRASGFVVCMTSAIGDGVRFGTTICGIQALRNRDVAGEVFEVMELE
ncbi:hypothetical protein BGZ61DRAFT_474923 [Ilyonectria robusta]|uniref:uncharacterized protein n=1 Tax=Ilyonectria robusta TaxID=1079257 RepID=UPI001E8D912C|nr:uncharacterized protein BGZ61DRAFT_474923 [Ilyonectria robusta]KAH8729281.1 hypothetical protein BGZ61DRAFT_474923 [Ilyonectria robusta]